MVAARAVDKLLGEGFSTKEIAVLHENPLIVREMREMTVRDESFGEYDSGAITVETIARYKGLESPAIVLVLERTGNRSRCRGICWN